LHTHGSPPRQGFLPVAGNPASTEERNVIMRTYNVRLWHNVRQAQYLNIEAQNLEDAKAKALKAYQDFLAYIDAPYLEREGSSYKWEEEGEDDELAFAAALDPVMSIEEEGRSIQQPERIDDVDLPYPYYGALLEFVKRVAEFGPDSGLAREARAVLKMPEITETASCYEAAARSEVLVVLA
jgi:hypothetical protein